MTDQVTAVLTKAKKILIVPNTQNNGDILFAALALNAALVQAGKQAYILSERLSNSAIWKYKLNQFKDVHPISGIPSRLMLSLDREKFDIKDLTWEEKNGKFNVFLDTGSDAVTSGKVDLKRTRTDFDLIIAIGTINPNALSDLGLDRDLLQNSSKMFIANNKIVLGDTVIAEAKTEGLKSFCLSIRNMLERSGTALPKISETLFLAGMIAHTNTFRKSISLELFDRIKELVKNGADYQASYELAVKDLTLKKAKLLSELLSRIDEVGEGIYFSQGTLPAGQKLKLKIDEVLKLAEIYDCRLAVVSIKSGSQNLIYLKSNDPGIDLKGILASLEGRGNMTQGMINTSRPAAELMPQILALVTGTKVKKKIKTKPVVIDRGKYESAVPVNTTATSAAEVNNGFDPLAPAGRIPEPLHLQPSQPKQPQDFSPLPTANQ